MGSETLCRHKAGSETLRTQEVGVARETLCKQKAGSESRKQEVKLRVRREKGQGVKLTLRRDHE